MRHLRSLGGGWKPPLLFKLPGSWARSAQVHSLHEMCPSWPMREVTEKGKGKTMKSGNDMRRRKGWFGPTEAQYFEKRSFQSVRSDDQLKGERG